MKHLIVFAFAVSTTFAAEIFRGTPALDDTWKQYKAQHGKHYQHPLHESARRKNWETARSAIKKHNEESAAGLHEFTVAENHLSDLHEDEKKTLCGYKSRAAKDTGRSVFSLNVDERALATSVNLTGSSCMPPVQNQGQCGSCWAFSAADTLGYALCKKTGKAVNLSKQQLVDCSTVNYGCNGGWYEEAWLYVQEALGQALASAYAYKAVAGACMYTSSMSAGTATGFEQVPPGDELAIRTAVATVGAVSATLQVVDNAFYYYKSGIYSSSQCTGNIYDSNHAVIIVGYGTQNSANYWIVRNSWATSWGLNGYMLIKRGVNACGIELNVYYPTV